MDLFLCTKHCPVFFSLVSGSFSRENVCKNSSFPGGVFWRSFVEHEFVWAGTSFDVTRSQSGRTKQCHVFPPHVYANWYCDPVIEYFSQTSSRKIFTLDQKCPVTVSDQVKILPVKTWISADNNCSMIDCYLQLRLLVILGPSLDRGSVVVHIITSMRYC